MIALCEHKSSFNGAKHTASVIHDIEQDLSWYFHEASTEMGVHSNFEAMRAFLECGGRTCNAVVMNISERRLNAATRARPIHRALDAIGVDHEKILRLAFGAESYPLLTPYLKHPKLALVSNVTVLAHKKSRTARLIADWLFRLCKRVARGLGDHQAQDRLLLRQIRLDTELMLNAALNEYLKSRRSHG